MLVRQERLEDWPAVRAVHENAFPSAQEADLVDRLRQAGKATLSLVAESDEHQVIGHVLFSPVTVQPPAVCRGLGLGPLAVLRDYQNTGVGSALCKAGLEECRRLMVDYVVVLGDPNYYRQFGFIPASQLNLENEYGVHDEFMVQVLTPGCLKNVRGVVRYSSEFADLT
jgi:putative acetyltransferase